MTFTEHERVIPIFGSEVRLLLGIASVPGTQPPELGAIGIEAFLRVIHHRLTRFDAESELSRLNNNPAESVAVSPLLARAIGTARWAAEKSAGLVDSTLVNELETIGYERSLVGRRERVSLSEALLAAPARCPAQPSSSSRWQEIDVDLDRLCVTRPPGVKIDSGGIGKGLAADLASERLQGYTSYVVDAGGDIRIGGTAPTPRPVEIEHPLSGGVAHTFQIGSGAIATSGISSRIWRTDRGYAHHILDPSTGRSAWTGLIQATALADSTREAELLAKMALLKGLQGAREILAEQGGVCVLDDGSVEVIDAAQKTSSDLAGSVA